MTTSFNKKYHFACYVCGEALTTQGEIGTHMDNRTFWYAVCKKHTQQKMHPWMDLKTLQNEHDHDQWIYITFETEGYECGMAMLEFLWNNSVKLRHTSFDIGHSEWQA